MRFSWTFCCPCSQRYEVSLRVDHPPSWVKHPIVTAVLQPSECCNYTFTDLERLVIYRIFVIPINSEGRGESSDTVGSQPFATGTQFCLFFSRCLDIIVQSCSCVGSCLVFCRNFGH